MRNTIFGGKIAGIVEMALLDLRPGGIDEIIYFMMHKKLLARDRKYVCRMDMRGLTSVIVAGAKCVSIRKGSFFFERSKPSLHKWLLLMHWWGQQYPVSSVAVKMVSQMPLLCKYYARLRDVCSHRLCQVDPL